MSSCQFLLLPEAISTILKLSKSSRTKHDICRCICWKALTKSSAVVCRACLNFEWKAMSHNYKINKFAKTASTGTEKTPKKLSSSWGDRKVIWKLNSKCSTGINGRCFLASLLMFVAHKESAICEMANIFSTYSSVLCDIVNILNVYLCIRNMWQMPQMFVINLIAFPVMFCCLFLLSLQFSTCWWMATTTKKSSTSTYWNCFFLHRL